MELVGDEQIGTWFAIGRQRHVIDVDVSQSGFALDEIRDELVGGLLFVRLFPSGGTGAERNKNDVGVRKLRMHGADEFLEVREDLFGGCAVE